MMQYNPTLKIKRLVVMRNDITVYDGRFHSGVNILRGDNSSGKSTILNMLFYGLGGELTDWSDIALLCTHVLVEATFNGMVATLRREISESAGRPMEIYSGDYAQSLRAPITDWSRYSYRRSETMESFSEALFRLLDIPEVTSDQTGNLTIHQILRLLYADQLSPVEQLFKFEPFDPPTLRDTVGRLLCGAYNSEVYNNDVRLKTLVRNFDQTSAQLKSLFAVLGRTDQAHTLDWIQAEKTVLKQKLESVQGQIEDAERQLYQSTAQDELTLTAQQQAYDTVQRLQQQIAAARETRDATSFSIADSDLFISSLQRKLDALSDSETVAKSLGDIQFRTCPSCYSAVEAAGEPNHCHLCKADLNEGPAHTRIVALLNETGRQLKQSQLLQQRRISELEKQTAQLNALEAEWLHASRRLSELQRLPSTALRGVLRQLGRDAGYVERQLEDLDHKLAIATEIQQLTDAKEKLNTEITRLRNRNDLLRAGQSKRLQKAYAAIDQEVVRLLHRDLPRQDAFISAKHVEFDFGANSITVDGQGYFSASSRVVLKTAFFVGFLWAATKDKEFRHPRFCILDTIEDKGMEQIRSHNFQRIIVEDSDGCNVDHQIIFATAMIAPELDDPKYTVGDYSTLSEATLAIRKPSLG
ncbi:AAA family ATPase [Affinirhizobium pseudoryzae]|uniref:AAA family ATPase n=1 Tax=Allorhizobium pseudoryzae TaxID=379684 RepID=UPI0013EC7143|nr:AAA family ATPase [Allorhizobium pseudoryzae]